MEGPKLDIRNLASKAALFQDRIRGVQESLPRPGFDWYPYDSIGNVFLLADLLTGERQFLLDLIGDGPVLDIGCGDGHISFFLESLGCKVFAVDNPGTNYNQMQGVRALKAALNSNIEIWEQNMDHDFALPDMQFSVAFFLGVLYHLKNPFAALESLLARSQYCILSTRVTGFSPDKSTNLSRLPVAYLVSETETNNDATNYWIFTNLGLKRLIERSGWRILDYVSVGNTSASDPITAAGDERALCLAERGISITNGWLASGWHHQEYFNAWRWTQKEFSVSFANIDDDARHVLSLDFFLPAALESPSGSLELCCSINGRPLPRREFAKSGYFKYEEPVPAAALVERPVVAEFTLSHAIRPGEHDPRELGIVVSSVRLS